MPSPLCNSLSPPHHDLMVMDLESRANVSSVMYFTTVWLTAASLELLEGVSTTSQIMGNIHVTAFKRASALTTVKQTKGSS